MSLTLHLALTAAEWEWCQRQIEQYHYLRRRIHPRARPLAYIVKHELSQVGCLIFGRMQSSRCKGWYGSWEDVERGWCRLTQWELLSLMRVWLDPKIQRGGEWYVPNAASHVVSQALKRVGYEYLLLYPPAYLSMPFQIREVLSYCQSSKFPCTLYLATSFQLVRENRQGLRTYVRTLPRLQPYQISKIREASQFHMGARRRRSAQIMYVQQTLLRRQLKRVA